MVGPRPLHGQTQPWSTPWCWAGCATARSSPFAWAHPHRRAASVHRRRQGRPPAAHPGVGTDKMCHELRYMPGCLEPLATVAVTAYGRRRSRSPTRRRHHGGVIAPRWWLRMVILPGPRNRADPKNREQSGKRLRCPVSTERDHGSKPPAEEPLTREHHSFAVSHYLLTRPRSDSSVSPKNSGPRRRSRI